MTSKLVSLARIIFLSKTAAVSRSAPAVIAGPLQRIFGGADENRTTDDDDGNEEQIMDNTANANGGEEITETEAATVVEQVTTTTVSNGQHETNKGIFAALVARAQQEETAATGGAAEFRRGKGPIASPFARHELRKSTKDYYRTAIMATSPDVNSINNINIINDHQVVTREPDLSIPVGDEFLYLAQ